MKPRIKEHSDFYKTFIAGAVLCAVFAAFSLAVLNFIPREFEEIADDASITEESEMPEEQFYTEECPFRADYVSWVASKETFSTIKIETYDSKNSAIDKGLELYRNPATRAAVEWFYLRVTGRRDVTLAILEAANREDIPLSLAFALCYTESRYNRYARNVNANGSIDRGLFQLNDRSFPRISNEDFYVAETSAKYGMQHLSYCISVAGNEFAGLAMYNAGITRVRNDQTPKSTLQYVGKIMTYRTNLEAAFAEEVLDHYERQQQQAEQVITVAMK